MDKWVSYTSPYDGDEFLISIVADKYNVAGCTLYKYSVAWRTAPAEVSADDHQMSNLFESRISY